MALTALPLVETPAHITRKCLCSPSLALRHGSCLPASRCVLSLESPVSPASAEACCAATAGDRPYLISGADDKLAKVWDYQTKACVQTLEGHGHNVSAVLFHPELPIIITGSEDGSVKFWHSTTYRLESTLNYGLERLWALGACKGSNQ